ncbi:MAG: hypothetical protein QM658_16140 [Gordonia sp. (in: high G+C Gram-positive bacteria)]
MTGCSITETAERLGTPTEDDLVVLLEVADPKIHAGQFAFDLSSSGTADDGHAMEDAQAIVVNYLAGLL